MIKANALPLKSIEKLRVSTPLPQIAEIRLRAGRQSVLTDIYGNMRPCSDVFSAKEIEDCFAEICRYSVYSFEDEIAQGFVTLDGGHRVGISGTAVTKNGKITAFKDISGLNIRIARQIKGCADEVYERCFKNGLSSLLLAGKPLSGKTTVLRDLARRLGEKYRVVIIDSRNEIAACVRGTPALDVGLNTDVLSGCEKSEGIIRAVRCLSPQVIVCDELGNDEAAVEQAMFCGVKLIASVHAGSVRELKSRAELKTLLPCFDITAVIGERGKLIELEAKGGR